MNSVMIESLQGHLVAFVIEENELVEVHSLDEWEDSPVGNIYRSRVLNILPGMDAAFVDIGEEKNGYLPFNELKPVLSDPKDLKPGDQLLVQVKREGTETKGPKLTCEISLPGRYFVLMPGLDQVLVSKKLKDGPKLRELKLWLDGERQAGEGVLIRTEGVYGSEDLWKRDLNYLRKKWEFVDARRDFLPIPKKVFEASHPLIELFHEMSSKEDVTLVVNDKAVLDILEGLIPEDLAIEIKPYDSIKYHPKYWRQFMEAFQERVPIPGGGELVIQDTEAMTVIDVNSGSRIKGRNLLETALDLNLEACKVIAKQVRLRNLNGIIVVDFIEMDEEGRKKVEDTLKTLFSHHANVSNVFGFTRLGLMEMTRRRRYRSLGEQKQVFQSFLEA